KDLATYMTFVRFLSCMHSLMCSEIRTLVKGFATHITSVRFLSRMNSPVIPEV
ncbi:hypothetical protein DBR06_SOUSAS11710037, partial [Sousa chinensis]